MEVQVNKISDPLKTLIIKCVGCADIQLNPERGIISRGFAFDCVTIREQDLMVIFPEPARSDSGERWPYDGAKRQGGWKGMATEANRVATEYSKSDGLTFHRKTMDLFVDVFRSQRAVFCRFYFAELTKCEKCPAIFR